MDEEENVIEGKFDDQASVTCPECKAKLTIKRVYAISKFRFACPKCRHKMIVKIPVDKSQKAEVVDIDKVKR